MYGLPVLAENIKSGGEEKFVADLWVDIKSGDNGIQTQMCLNTNSAKICVVPTLKLKTLFHWTAIDILYQCVKCYGIYH